VVDYTSTEFKLKLEFENPFDVSTGESPDILKVSSYEVSQLEAKDSGNTIFFVSKQVYIPPQGPPEGFAALLQSSLVTPMQATIALIATGNIVVQVVAATSLQSLWGMVNALQVITYFCLIKLEQAGHVYMVKKLIHSFYTLDPVTQIKYAADFLSFLDDNDEEISPHFTMMGMESSNFFYNSGRVMIVLSIVPFFYLLVYLARTLPLNSRLRLFMEKTFFHSFIIRLLLESCFELGFYSYVSLR